ncbi:MAG TPA: SWIM zinc finger family protein, partial [Polyangiaceae bacterium]
MRRKAVADLEIADASATGHVKGTEPVPYDVKIGLTPTGFDSNCTCPAFSKIHGHCKHVAALFIALRDQARGTTREPREMNGRAAMDVAQAAGLSGSSVNGGVYSAGGHGGDMSGGGGGRRSRRARARAMKLAGGGAAPGGQQQQGRGSGIVSTGVDAWLPEPMPPVPKIEYRLQVRPGSLSVTVMDPNQRTPLLPSTLLTSQSEVPGQDREAIRLLARFENEGPRKVGIEVKGEDASDLLPLLKKSRVILEPQMMELRFGDEALRPRFDLELSQDGAAVRVSSSFQRPGDPRKFTTAQGAWFEGSPGWFVDPQEGVARPIDRRVSPASIRRLTRAPFIHEPVERL